jgi:hypothetical protein
VRPRHGQPIKFVGVSEKMDGLEAFHPERMASRILGMGDILSLVEEARAKVDEKEADAHREKFKKGKDFDLEDFKSQLQQMKKMGGIASLADKLPAQLTQMAQASPELQEKALRRTEGIINSMTPQERRKPELLKASRKRRIAAGAGVQVQEVNRLLTQFEQMQKMMKMMRGGNLAKMMRNMKGMVAGDAVDSAAGGTLPAASHSANPSIRLPTAPFAKCTDGERGACPAWPLQCRARHLPSPPWFLAATRRDFPPRAAYVPISVVLSCRSVDGDYVGSRCFGGTYRGRRAVARRGRPAQRSILRGGVPVSPARHTDGAYRLQLEADARRRLAPAGLGGVGVPAALRDGPWNPPWAPRFRFDVHAAPSRWPDCSCITRCELEVDRKQSDMIPLRVLVLGGYGKFGACDLTRRLAGRRARCR